MHPRHGLGSTRPRCRSRQQVSGGPTMSRAHARGIIVQHASVCTTHRHQHGYQTPDGSRVHVAPTHYHNSVCILSKCSQPDAELKLGSLPPAAAAAAEPAAAEAAAEPPAHARQVLRRSLIDRARSDSTQRRSLAVPHFFGSRHSSNSLEPYNSPGACLRQRRRSKLPRRRMRDQPPGPARRRRALWGWALRWWWG